jgi:hypothetical protein
MARTGRQAGNSAGPADVETVTSTDSLDRQVVTIGDAGGNDVDSIGSLTETAPATDTASSGLNGRLQRVAQRLTSLLALLPTALTPGALALKTGFVIGNPSSVLTRPANTTAYAANQLVGSSTTAGSVVVPSFTATPNADGAGSIKRFRLYTNKTSGMGGVTFQIDLWTTAPAFTNGDGGAYAVATGAAGWIGSVTTTLVQAGDGAYFVAIPDVGNQIDFVLASGQVIFWSMQAMGAFTPVSGQTFTLVPEITQY